MSSAPIIHDRGVDDLSSSGRTRGAFTVLLHLDCALAATVILMALGGIAILHGATEATPGLAANATKQMIFFVIALAAMFTAYLVDYRWINRFAITLYVLNFGALIYVLLFGSRINNARSWIDLGPVNWQPAETMKIAAVVLTAQWLALKPEELESWRSIIIPALLCGVPGFLILIQPDLGSASLFFAIFLVMMLMAGAKLHRLALILSAAAAGMACMFPFLPAYQKARLISFMNPEAYFRSSGYHVIQSKIAIGNGGLTGQGLGEGSQSNFGFLPEHHTDFIFASAVEQLGFLGAAAILAGYFLLLLQMLRAMDKARDRFGGLMVAGLMAIILGHIMVNVGMNLGLTPITGIPLPLLSYGGTFLVTTLILFGLVLNVASRRYTFAGY